MRKSKVLKIEENMTKPTKVVIEEHDLMSVNNDQHNESTSDNVCNDVAVDDPVIGDLHTVKENFPQKFSTERKVVKSVKKME